LLTNLPKLLKGYGRTFAGYPKEYHAAVLLVCDIDDRCRKSFRGELQRILAACHPKPKARFCFAIEEGEAWFLGDLNAVKSAYPSAKGAILAAYKNDSNCGTWEKLADAVYPGGVSALSAKGWQAVGVEKSRWAEAIAPLMNTTENRSPSFCYFRDKLQELAQEQ
jgi:hypothetical protein